MKCVLALGQGLPRGTGDRRVGSRGQIARQWKIAKRFEPKMKRDEAARRMEEWKRALERARGWGKG